MITIDISYPSQGGFIRFLFFLKQYFFCFELYLKDKYFIMAVQYPHLFTLPVDSIVHVGKAVTQVGQVVIIMQTTSAGRHPSRAERCNLLINLMDKKYKTPKNTCTILPMFHGVLLQTSLEGYSSCYSKEGTTVFV